MALRALLRKVPALGLRSAPVGGPVRALSPAAGSRLMSHGGQGGEVVTGEELARGRQFYKGLEELRETRRQFSRVLRADIEEYERKKKILKMIMIASNTVIAICVPTTVYMLTNFE